MSPAQQSIGSTARKADSPITCELSTKLWPSIRFSGSELSQGNKGIIFLLGLIQQWFPLSLRVGLWVFRLPSSTWSSSRRFAGQAPWALHAREEHPLEDR